MNKNDTNNEVQSKEKEKLTDETKTNYRKISEVELDQIIENHQNWLESDAEEGLRANLSDVDLSGHTFLNTDLSQAFFDRSNFEKANFSGCTLKKTVFNNAVLNYIDFSYADLKNASLSEAQIKEGKLTKAKLQNAILKKTNLVEAKLAGAELNGANLFRSDMRKTDLESVVGLNEANLQYANLEGATGLLGNEFAQADVTGTKLPDGIKDFKALETVEKTSQNARKVFSLMLLVCVYSWLTIATTTDVNLLTNSASSPLPIIGTEIPIAWFYIAAPLVLICIYFYFHLYLIKLWEALSGLPAIFPDGKRLDEIAYPWLFNGLVRRHFRLLKTDRPFIAHVQEWITIILAWWVVPINMICFWIRYIPRHDWLGSSLQIVLIVLSIVFGLFFFRMSALTLKGKEKHNLSSLKSLSIYIFTILLTWVTFFILSFGAINGEKLQNFRQPN